MIARVIFINKQNFFILPANKNDYCNAKIKGKINMMPIVGDYVRFKVYDDTNLIISVLERKNFLTRPNVSNIDFVNIVCSLKEPQIKLSLINSYILYYQIQNFYNINIIFTKFDLLNSTEKKTSITLINFYRKLGYTVFVSETDIECMMNYFKNKTSVFVGQTGVGKSTLLNKIDPLLNLKTNIISNKLKRGKHTTTNCLLINNSSLYLIDTPGFSSIKLSYNKNDIAKNYLNYYEYYINCKFSNCLHLDEKKCAVKNNLDEKNNFFIDSYLFYKELIKQN